MTAQVNERRLRIAVLGTRGIPEVMGGVETHCQALYPRLAAKGHSITLFARKGYVPNDAYSYQGVTVEPLWTPKRKSLEALFHTAFGVLLVALRRKEFDLLHIHAIGPSLLTPFAKFLGVKVIMTHHGPDYDRQKWGEFAKFMLRLGERLGCRYADAVITVSQHIQATIEKLYNCHGGYIPNGVPLPELLAAAETLKKFGLRPKKYFLAVGRFVPEKGFDDLLKAFRNVDTDWQLVIAGAADHEDSYSSHLRALAAEDSRVVLTGFIKGNELTEVYSNAALFVLPSYHEGLPIALLEAMSYDLSILASDIPANKELASEQETFPVGDVDALAQRLTEFLAKPLQAESRRGRIEKQFNWDLVAAETERTYLSATS